MKIKPDFTRLHSGENESRTIHFSLSERYRDKSVKLCFISPMGRLYMTDPLSHSGGEGSFTLTGSLLDGKGVLLCQLICFSDDGYLAKSPVLELPVFYSADDMSCSAISEEGLKSFAFIIDALENKTDRQEITELLKGKSDTDHLHRGVYLTEEDLWEYLPTHPSAGYEHTHDGRYYTKPEADSRYYTKEACDDRYYSKAQTDEKIAALSQDFVVEQGKTDGWTYRKWNSGEAQCRGTISFTPAETVAAGGNIRPKKVFPFTFVTTPDVFVQRGALAYKVKKTYPLSSTGAECGIYAQLEADSGLAVGENISFLVEAKGRWK